MMPSVPHLADCQCLDCLWRRSGKARHMAWIRLIIDAIYREHGLPVESQWRQAC